MANKTPRLGPTNIDRYIDKVWNFEYGCDNQQAGLYRGRATLMPRLPLDIRYIEEL